MSSIKGIDISNNEKEIDFSGVVGYNVKYVYLKATEGQTYQDAYMDSYYNSCKNYNLKVGAYHFLKSTSEPEDQAQNFFDTIKNYSWDLIPFLDVEENFSSLTDYVTRFIDKFNELVTDNKMNLKLGIYTYTSFLECLSSIQDSIKALPFWQADYNDSPWNVSDTFFLNRVGHQYTETGTVTGINCNCDIDVFTEDVLIGQWIQDNTGWWYKYSDGSFPKSTWLQLNGEWFYFKDNGYMATGWLNDSSNSSYYYLYSTGQMATGWVHLDSWYYFSNTGVMQVGWLPDNGNWYFLNNSGAMTIGWLQIDSNWYYFDNKGIMTTGWIQVNNTWYYMNSKGAMVTGWIQLNGYWYYLNDKGAMVTGWQQINDNSYYFYSDGKMAVNTITPDGYTVDSDGAWDSSIPKK